MDNMVFKGQLSDFLENKKSDILRLIKFGVLDEDALYEEFQIAMPIVNFNNPVDITQFNNGDKSYFILKFAIAGNLEILNYKPSVSFAEMPDWVIRNGEIWIKIEERDLDSTKVIITGMIKTFKSHLADICFDIMNYDRLLRDNIRKLINAHHNEIGQQSDKIFEIRHHLIFGLDP